MHCRIDPTLANRKLAFSMPVVMQPERSGSDTGRFFSRQYLPYSFHRWHCRIRDIERKIERWVNIYISQPFMKHPCTTYKKKQFSNFPIQNQQTIKLLNFEHLKNKIPKKLNVPFWNSILDFVNLKFEVDFEVNSVKQFSGF